MNVLPQNRKRHRVVAKNGKLMSVGYRYDIPQDKVV
jgi:hypothetical protein